MTLFYAYIIGTLPIYYIVGLALKIRNNTN